MFNKYFLILLNSQLSYPAAKAVHLQCPFPGSIHGSLQRVSPCMWPSPAFPFTSKLQSRTARGLKHENPAIEVQIPSPAAMCKAQRVPKEQCVALLPLSCTHCSWPPSQGVLWGARILTITRGPLKKINEKLVFNYGNSGWNLNHHLIASFFGVFFSRQESLHLIHADGYLIAASSLLKRLIKFRREEGKKKPSTWKTLHCFFI